MITLNRKERWKCMRVGCGLSISSTTKMHILVWLQSKRLRWMDNSPLASLCPSVQLDRKEHTNRHTHPSSNTSPKHTHTFTWCLWSRCVANVEIEVHLSGLCNGGGGHPLSWFSVWAYLSLSVRLPGCFFDQAVKRDALWSRVLIIRPLVCGCVCLFLCLFNLVLLLLLSVGSDEAEGTIPYRPPPPPSSSRFSPWKCILSLLCFHLISS